MDQMPRAKSGKWFTRGVDDVTDMVPDESPGMFGAVSGSQVLDEPVYDSTEDDEFIDGGNPTTTFQDDLDGGTPDPADYLDGGAP